METAKREAKAADGDTFLDRLSSLLDWWEGNAYARLAAPAFFTLLGAIITTHYASFADPAELGNPLLMSCCVLVAFAASFTRHRFPRASLAIECAAAVVAGLNDWSNLIFFSFALALYRVMARCRPLEAIVGALVACACYCLPALLAENATLDLIQGMLAWFVVVALLALASRLLHKRQIAARRAREEHEARKQAEAQRAQAVEKNRIAGELHDSVGHDLTAIIALSEGLGATVHDGELKQALSTINELARSGLADTRRAVRALSVREEDEDHTDDAPAEHLHTADDIRGLLDTARATGIAAALTETGQPTGDAMQMELAFRIAREGVTNALRHAVGMKRLTVSLDHHADGSVALSVRDDGTKAAAADAPNAVGSADGTGLARLRHDIEQAGGALFAGAGLHGGWELRAELPAEHDKGTHRMSRESEEQA